MPTIDSNALADRRGIRNRIRQQRRHLNHAQRTTAARQLTQQLKQSSLFLRSKHIAFYLANDGEIDLQPLIQQAWAMGKQCYLPVLCPAFHKRLWFAPYQAETPMQRNIFGILEPRLPWRDMRPIFSLDLILTPLVAFDLQGNRLGMGGVFMIAAWRICNNAGIGASRDLLVPPMNSSKWHSYPRRCGMCHYTV